MSKDALLICQHLEEGVCETCLMDVLTHAFNEGSRIVGAKMSGTIYDLEATRKKLSDDLAESRRKTKHLQEAIEVNWDKIDLTSIVTEVIKIERGRGVAIAESFAVTPEELRKNEAFQGFDQDTLTRISIAVTVTAQNIAAGIADPSV